MKTLHDRLVAMGACAEAVEWVGDKDLVAAARKRQCEIIRAMIPVVLLEGEDD
jgi:hypothetical protein